MVRIHTWASCIDLHVHSQLASTYLTVAGGLGGQAVKKSKTRFVLATSEKEKKGRSVRVCFVLLCDSIMVVMKGKTERKEERGRRGGRKE